MNGISEKALVGTLSPKPADRRNPFRIRSFLTFLIASTVLLVAFSKPLYELLRLSLTASLHSHIILIPAISAYLIWTRYATLPGPSRGPLSLVAGGVLAGLVLLALPILLHPESSELLSLRILAFWVFLLTAALAFLGWRLFKAISFPLAFLIFIVPLPNAIIHPLEIASQHASAEAYAWIMDATQSTYFREGFQFMLPGITIEVAEECSGIRSSIVLFIVGLLAGYLFLSSPWRRLAFALFVFPLGIARNAFRIFTLSFLTVHWDRSVIDGPLHHKGGPIFFALSLIPFCLVLFWFCRSEKKKLARHPGEAVSNQTTP